MDRADFGARVRALRSAARLTQEQLGEKLHVTGQAISHWEAGRSLPQAVEVPAIAAALDVSICELYGVEEGHGMPVTLALADQLSKILGVDAERIEINVITGNHDVEARFEPTRADWDTKQMLEIWPAMTEAQQKRWLAAGRQIQEEEDQ